MFKTHTVEHEDQSRSAKARDAAHPSPSPCPSPWPGQMGSCLRPRESIGLSEAAKADFQVNLERSLREVKLDEVRALAVLGSA